MAISNKIRQNNPLFRVLTGAGLKGAYVLNEVLETAWSYNFNKSLSYYKVCFLDE